MTLGILARGDRGGIAAQTREVHRHLHPDRTLLIDVPDAHRGPCETGDYTHGDVYRCEFGGRLSTDAIDWIVTEGIDVLWTVETWYDDRVVRQAHHAGIRTVTYTNPELAPWAIPGDTTARPRALHVPTWWRLDTLPNAQLLPQPVARDRLPFKRRADVRHLYHQAGTPFHDRNGTDILLAALPFVASPDLRLTIRSDKRLTIPPCNVDVGYAPAVADYWDAYPTDIDLLVMPRRYGGLCLPVQECASLGVPALMLDSDPYAGLPFVASVPSVGSRSERMKGGWVNVHSADPRTIAAAIDHLVEHPDVQAVASDAADVWAVEHDWAGPLGDRWNTMLGADR